MNAPLKIPPTVLIADDNSDDCLIALRAWEESQLDFQVKIVHDGRELLDYLNGRRKYRLRKYWPLPQLILLDLNMPRKDGRQVLLELQSHPEWNQIPIVVLSDSTKPKDIQEAEDIGAYDFITKPGTFQEHLHLVRTLGQAILHRTPIPFL